MFPRFKTAVYKMFHPREASAIEKLGDFTITPRVIPIAGLAVVIGFVSAFVALALLKLIGLFHQPVLLPALEHRAGLAGGQSPGPVGGRWCRWSAR